MTGWVYHRQSPLQIYGPKGTKNFVDSIIKAYEEDPCENWDDYAGG